ncbi:heavy-metal-associated domain-containing protein [Myroides guanonis]|uniref:Copper chaperone CopZ n=1 Tax=Myroides guanonis TaxID=1150112 RepID=A0A1I3MJ81_9FLAO|nr:cation transporter [Myroides guanonis]SFI97043.1 Copper chaperone CopZ [Myroides guanonis]
MKNYILIALASFFSIAINAQEKPKNKEIVEVNGQCGMCKKRIEKAALSVKGVRAAEWSVDNKQLELFLNPKKVDVLEVEKAIAKVGHDTKHVKATEEEYNSLHSCCKYERK